jgi:ribosomal protein L22
MADENDKTEKAEKPKRAAKPKAEQAEAKPKAAAKPKAEPKAKAEKAEPKAAKAKADETAEKPRRAAKPKADEGAKAEAKPKAKAAAKKADEDAEPKAEAKPKETAKSTRKPAAKSRRRAAADGAAPARPVVRAQAKYVRSSARKARLVCDHIRGKSVDEARAILQFTPRAVARDWSKLLESAVANAENNHELIGDDLFVKAAHADEGPTLKRFRPRAMGRATPIRKRTSHLTILLTPKE